ncbi:hypothetical protein [Pararhodobacter zhoushanensis]|uniref:Uncharacterized protein n=1 Tax=Pararhodobacter zhoushanensis TaxID=2479545 RepID=A0ABT3GZL2_9RHOB|nr:hypothetical protein [Pararhodobacter zhoushanensis]MCW1932972.1 hypothetical protein [Pararhodobacter zhoushanensis]
MILRITEAGLDFAGPHRLRTPRVPTMITATVTAIASASHNWPSGPARCPAAVRATKAFERVAT